MTTDKRIGKYEIAEQIGVGGFGIVYKAWDPFIQRWVAVKSCNATDGEATQRFFREAQLAGAHELKLVWPDGSEYREAAKIAAARAVTRVVRPQ